MIRKPIVAGQFYPLNAKDIGTLISSFQAKSSQSKMTAKGLILPHAGYIYSGKVAVSVVSQVIAQKRIIILGPNHTGYGKEFALWEKGSWEIPGKSLVIDEELASLILQKGDTITSDTLAHQYEHSIEVELPILEHFFGEFKFTPIACMVAKLDEYRLAAKQITSALKALKEPVMMIASSDMTHYEPDAGARKKDSLAIECILNLDEEALIKTIKKNDISMCGIAPVAIMLAALKEMNSTKARLIMYQTSGDATGDTSSVVGYAGILVQ
jgi:AmmeMemoRadiSam system protein B